MSESLRSGTIPWWDPYLNFGFPLHADMNSGFWSPVTWLFAGIIGYNAYTIVIELFIYLFIAGIGMYKAGKFMGYSKVTNIVIGISYSCCGFMVGHLQHFNWIAGAAFLPFVFIYYKKLLTTFSVKNLILCTLSIYFFAVSAHPGLTITLIYFLFILFLYHLVSEKKSHKFLIAFKKIILSHSLLIALLILCLAGMIISYYELIPYFSRGNKVSLPEALVGAFRPANFITFLAPLASVKNDTFFATDISIRNIYFGFAPFLCFIFLVLYKKKSSLEKWLLFSLLFFLLISIGGIFKVFAYNFLPGFAYIRASGIHRIFVIFIILLLSGKVLDELIKFQGPGILYNFFTVLLVIFILALVPLIIWFVYSGDSVLTYVNLKLLTRTGLKSFLNSLSFLDVSIIQVLIQLILIFFCIRLIKNRSAFLPYVFILDVVVNCLIYMPFSAAGKTKVGDIQAIIDTAPKGIPIPPIQSIRSNQSQPDSINNIIGDWSLYNKAIGVRKMVSYPSRLVSSLNYFDSEDTSLVSKKPFISLTPEIASSGSVNSSKSTLKIINFTPNRILIDCSNQKEGNLTILYSWYPGWNCYINQRKENIQKVHETFMNVSVPQGTSNILLIYKPNFVIIGSIISLIILSFLLLVLIIISLNGKQDFR